MITQKDIEEYKLEMMKWIVQNTDQTALDVVIKFQMDQDAINELFEPYPETIVSEDVGKWAELLAVRWGCIEEPEIIFSDE